MKNMLDSDKFKGTCPEDSRGSRWIYATGPQNDQNPIISNADLASIRNEIKSNQEKQLKLTDLYLNNSLSKTTFEQKNEALRQEEEGLRSKIAGLELLLIEKENSKDYLDRVHNYFTNYDPEKKELDAAAKKEILALIFKKILIKNQAKNAAAAVRISPFWYSPFDKIISEEENTINGNRKGKIAPILYQNVRLPDERGGLNQAGRRTGIGRLSRIAERKRSRRYPGQYLCRPAKRGGSGGLVYPIAQGAKKNQPPPQDRRLRLPGYRAGKKSQRYFSPR
jgi:hypothetical protein